jgi:hypothetical protein
MTEKRMPSRAKKGVDNKLKQIVVGSIVSAILAAILGTTSPWWWDHLFPQTPPQQQKPKINPPVIEQAINSRFNFESGVMGWLAYDGFDSKNKGCISVKATDERPYSGKQSLEITLSVSATNSAINNGQARVTIATIDPEGNEQPISLEGHTISAQLYTPQGSYGPTDAWNSAQLFVKDANGEFLFSKWRKLSEDQWIELQLLVSNTTELKARPNSKFDPTQIKILGIMFSTDKKSSTATYNGAIWLDDVNW